MAIANLPDDILIEIFSRLPEKSIGKCRCLARQWRTLLSTPDFIKAHLTRRPHQESLLFITPSRSICSIDAIKDGGVSRKLELPNNWAKVVGSCDGLVLLLNENNEMFLVNPITVQQVRIPDSPLPLNRDEGCSMHGFGHDRIEHDYKIVTLSFNCDADIEDDPYSIDTFVDVYSVKRSAWRRTGISPYNHAILGFSSGVFVNGAIHWYVCCKHGEELTDLSVIVAFDLALEVFNEIPTPKGFGVDQLVVLGGCLGLVDIKPRIRTDIWVMEEYGLAESWTIIFHACSNNPQWDWHVVNPLCYIGDEEVVLVTCEASLVVHNMEEDTLRDMIVDGVPAMFTGGCTFVGSLISPAFIV